MNTSVLNRSWLIARDLTAVTLKFVALAWAVVLVVLTVALSFYAASAQPEVSVVDFATSAPRYWVGVWALAVTATMMRVYIGAGYTRTEFFLGMAATGVVISVVVAAAMTIMVGGEALLYSAMGWGNAISDGGLAHMYSHNSQFGLIFLETVVIYTAHAATGALIGAIYNRIHRGVLATGFAIAAYVFAVLAEATVNSGWPGIVLGLVVDAESSVLVGVVGGTLTIAVTFMLGWLVIRRAPVRAKCM